ncbi:fumarylacetoacetate hydrolase family protein [Xanthomonas hyacinthi]|uniref:FAA hydrolase family protein n=1 Tax=Xanthomonas hyacinthi TaxID=56455 RepID=A0A2S7EY68_9XANT|nr:fumarylacetoacetate hydrolase family protein [Xanthomonas hyacinthi]KLD77781.1 2-hydroxyhepta-2,4-diene-1,7-dioate isomerase [Xanthomonas hyacinthi DSM 19077]PPU98083.1 FAA hydrolase family protein [Xanthomonas hyacinthi]QGY76879.1 fumarylacetoacetate hydrolase family protein [Xanthomonas hyacinthi]
MKICFFDEWRLGVIEGNQVLDVTAALDSLPATRYPHPSGDLFIRHLDVLKPVIQSLQAEATRKPLAQVSLRSPVPRPGKLIAAPVNYQAHLDEAIADTATFSRAHARKIQETGVFLKATSSLIGVGQPIVIGLPDRRTDHEIELAVVIGKPAKQVKAADALDHVAGYSIGLDITIRGPEERSLRKSLDTYSVLGPWLVTADELQDPSGRELLLQINDEVRQRANTRDLILDVGQLIEFASKFYSLEPGDVIFTGTPEGVGPIHPGDRLCASISGIGKLEMAVTHE